MIDSLPKQLDEFLERARAGLNQEISTTRATSAKLKREVADAQTALAEIEHQQKQAQANLSDVLTDIDRLSALVGVGSDIAKAKADLEKMRSEVEKASVALAGLRKQQGEEEHKLQALRNETSRLGTLRNEHETAIGAVRALVKSFG